MIIRADVTQAEIAKAVSYGKSTSRPRSTAKRLSGLDKYRGTCMVFESSQLRRGPPTKSRTQRAGGPNAVGRVQETVGCAIVAAGVGVASASASASAVPTVLLGYRPPATAVLGFRP